MRLTAPLTTANSSRFVVLALCAAAVVGCASNSPRKPTAAQDKSDSSVNSFNQTCYDAQTTGAPPPIGCPQYQQYQQNRRRVAPGMTVDPLPTLPGAEIPNGGLLRR